MNAMLKMFLFLALCAGFLTQTAAAETISGTVQEVQPENNSIVIHPEDARVGRGLPDALRLKVEGDAQFSGVENLEQLEVGDAVTIEADRNWLNQWKAEAIDAEPAADEPMTFDDREELAAMEPARGLQPVVQTPDVSTVGSTAVSIPVRAIPEEQGAIEDEWSETRQQSEVGQDSKAY